ncbi:MAG: DUF4082 domain-containing protein, partial [Oscillochloris sp.]|nr:DUF4082 domain-containing protein [Oscillochloris sp.]
PFITRSVADGQDYLFNAEYPMVRGLERNGYDVSYFTGVDSDRRGALITNHAAFLSVGHDEYWSGAQRANVEAARAAGVNLAFFSSNEVYWKTRWENSIDGSGTPYRTLVSYKESHNDAKIDPTETWTGQWRDPRFSPPTDGGRPENALTGQIFGVNDGATAAITVPAEDGKLRFWRNTSIANLAPGSSATLPFGTLGYEWDVLELNSTNPAAAAVAAAQPPGQLRLSTTIINNAPLLRDYASNDYQNSFSPLSTATHHLTLYRHSSGAIVFGSGTLQWSWGLDSNHDRGHEAVDVRMQQATVNLLADMGVLAATLQSGLVQTTASSDNTEPNTLITAPLSSGTLTPNQVVVVSGTASDIGGVVGVVELSTDNGATWHRASGQAIWTISVNASASGTLTILARAVDDSLNIESTPASMTLGSELPSNTPTSTQSNTPTSTQSNTPTSTQSNTPTSTQSNTPGAVNCPCSLWSNTTVPNLITDLDRHATELGMKFTASEDGVVTGIRFYKGPQNTGTHTGSLWTGNGSLLARATFTNETASGWQQVNLATPVAITAGQIYVVSYHAPKGKYSQDTYYFTTSYSRGPLRALADGESGANGVYIWSSTPTFPNKSYYALNSYVDIIFEPGVLVSPTSTPTSGPRALIGVTTIGANLDWNPAGIAEAFTYTASQSGTAGRIYLYVDSRNAATKLIVGLYADNGTNAPGALLTQGTITSPTAKAWNSVTVPGVTVTAGQQYWIAVMSPLQSGRAYFRNVTAGSAAQTSALTTLSALPTTWQVGRSYSNSPLSAYITGEP